MPRTNVSLGARTACRHADTETDFATRAQFRFERRRGVRSPKRCIARRAAFARSVESSLAGSPSHPHTRGCPCAFERNRVAQRAELLRDHCEDLSFNPSAPPGRTPPPRVVQKRIECVWIRSRGDAALVRRPVDGSPIGLPLCRRSDTGDGLAIPRPSATAGFPLESRKNHRATPSLAGCPVCT